MIFAIATALEGMEHGLGAVRRNPEHRAAAVAVAAGAAAILRRAVEIARLVGDETGKGLGAVAPALEGVEHGLAALRLRCAVWNEHRQQAARDACADEMENPNH